MFFAFRKDVLRLIQDPSAVLMGVAIPLVVVLIMKVAFGGGDGGAPKAKLLVADQDQSTASGIFVGALSQGPLADLMDVTEVGPGAGDAELRREQASAVLTIRPGLQESLLADRPDTLHLLTNPSQTILPLMATGILESLGDVVFYLQRLAGDELRAVLNDDAPVTAAGLSPLLETLGGKAERIQDMVATPPITLVKASLKEEAAEDVSLGELVLPAMLLMGLLFMAQGISGDLWQEREQGTLRRVVSTPASVTGWFLGKTAAAALAGALLAVLGFALARFAFGVPVFNMHWGVLWTACIGASLFALFAMIQSLATTRRGGGILTSLIVFPLAMLGGSFFPFEAMPEGLAALGVWTPNGSAVQSLKGILRESPSWETAHMAVVGLVLVGCFGATLLLLKRLVRRGAA